MWQLFWPPNHTEIVLLQKLKAQGLDVDAAIRKGPIFHWMLSRLSPHSCCNGMPDSARFFEAVGAL